MKLAQALFNFLVMFILIFEDDIAMPETIPQKLFMLVFLTWWMIPFMLEE